MPHHHTSSHSISSFVRFNEGETFQRDYYIAHTNKKRFNVAAILAIVVGLAFFIIPGIIMLVAFALRKVKVSHGHACLTNQRIIYYEYNSHPEENYHLMRSLHLADLKASQFHIARNLFSKSFYMVLWSSKKGIVVGAEGLIGVFNALGSQKKFEPGPDALEFVRDMSSDIAARKRALAA